MMRNDTEYMYASARIRAAEGRDTAEGRLARMLDCRSTEMLLRTIVELGFLSETRTPPSTLTEALDMALDDAAALMQEVAPTPETYAFLLYKYDCNNLKTAVKAGILGLDYADNYYTCGTFDPRDLTERLAVGDISYLPTHMGSAAQDAMAAYARTGEGRQIDFLLDKACYADIAENVAKTGVPLFQAYVVAKADSTNILSSVRLSRRQNDERGSRDAAASVFTDAFVPGGEMPLDCFLHPGEGCLDYTEIEKLLSPGPLLDAVQSILRQGEHARAEKAFDDAVCRLMNAEKYVPFGVHVPAMFFVNREMELKNARIIGAGLTAGLSGAALRERVRAEYV